MASPTQWTWVCVSSGSWWWTGKPGVLQSMGSQRVRHDWVTELNWTDANIMPPFISTGRPLRMDPWADPATARTDVPPEGMKYGCEGTAALLLADQEPPGEGAALYELLGRQRGVPCSHAEVLQLQRNPESLWSRFLTAALRKQSKGFGSQRSGWVLQTR